MGESWGRALIFFVICDIGAVLVLSQHPDDAFCPIDCNTQEDGHQPTSSCMVIPTDCDVPMDVPTWVANDSYHGNPPFITKIFSTPSISQNAFGFEWLFSSRENIKEVTDVVVKLSLGNKVLDCQLYDFRHSNLSMDIGVPNPDPTFHYCYNGSLDGAVVQLELKVASSNISTLYSILPVQGKPVLSAKEWRTPLAITADPLSASVTMVIEYAPPVVNMSTYHIHLMTAPNTVVQWRSEKASETVFTFTNLTRGETYHIKLTMFSPDCHGATKYCQELVSPDVHLALLPTSTTAVPPPPLETSTDTVPATISMKTTIPSMTVLIKTTMATDPSVLVKPAEKREEYEKSLKIILGTVFGFAALVLIVAIIIICIYKRRRGRLSGPFPMQRFGHGNDSDSSIGIEDAYKQLPTVLLLYSYDCDVHERVVIEFANYMQFIGNCDVMFDVWDQHLVQETSIFQWIQDKVDLADFVIVICSTGARFKCVRNKHFRMKQDRPIPDAFSWAVDLVAEKIRTAKNDGVSTSKYVVAYFDYAGHSDIPPKLDNAKKFCLMKDIFNLYCHVHVLKADTKEDTVNMSGITADTYGKTEVGKSLDKAVAEGKDFFKENPDWLGKILEPLSPNTTVLTTTTTTTTNTDEKSSMESVAPKSPVNSIDSHPQELSKSSSSSSSDEIFIEEHKKKRHKETNLESHEVRSPEHSVGTGGSQATPTSSSVSSSSPLMQPSQVKVTNSHGGRATKNGSQGSLPQIEITMETNNNVINEDEELQRDIDFIQNYDANHRYSVHSDGADLLTGLELGGYTPPEEFRSLASLVETMEVETSQA